MREAEIQRLHRVLQQGDRNAYEARNAARVAAEELARRQLMYAGAAPRVATPPPQFVGSPRFPLNASPGRPTDLHPPMDLGGDGPGYDREEDLMREELAREGGTPATGEGTNSRGGNEGRGGKGGRERRGGGEEF